MPLKESPHLPLNFKFETPDRNADPKEYSRREMERIVEYVKDHILALRQEIERLEGLIP